MARENKAHPQPWWVTVTNKAYYETIREDAGEGETNWTIARQARRGDRVLLYCTAPLSAIVAAAEIVTDPIREEDPNSTWYRSWFSDMTGLHMIEPLVTRATLIAIFPLWRYWLQPRLPTRVPTEYVERLSELLGSPS